MIGRSFSFCIPDIASGKVKLEDVEVIVTSTKFENDDDFNMALEEYADIWNENTTKCLMVAYDLYRNGRLFQPRLFDNNLVQDIYDRSDIWVNDIEDCKYIQ